MQKYVVYCGTIMTIWMRESMPCDNIEEGNERIVCIRIKVKPTPILIVSVYMPCRGNRSGDEEYKECLDILFEITRKYVNIFLPSNCSTPITSWFLSGWNWIFIIYRFYFKFEITGNFFCQVLFEVE
jgi:hypothetical protein